ncbi:ComEC family competence protein [Patescibacteria group bacterium]|nr:ComEC family competence protein [Patescibacteria group bacterium]MBU1877111.1 ComEC family competence protein [Patescibacteria group bacterium]
MTHSKILFYSCLLFIGGIFLYSLNIKLESRELKKYFDKKIVLTGIIIEEPDQGEKTTKLTVQPTNSQEKILIIKWHYPEYKYGDKLEITGLIQEPQPFEGFNYKDYLAKDGIFGVMYQPKIELLEKNRADSLKSTLINIKNKLTDSLNRIMPTPQSAFLEALIFGQESNISDEWKEKLNLTGTRHIAAVSGMNITILTLLISDFLLFLGFWKKQALYSSIVLIFFYILMIGAPISAIRAGIMATFFLAAQYLGRSSNGLKAVVLAATIMLLFNPLLLTKDIGFQLSFSAIIGLVFLQSKLCSVFGIIPDSFQLRYNLSSTLAAQIFALPILIYNFGQISLLSPITNILILPFLTIITILGFISMVAAVFWQGLGQFLSWPAWMMLTYLIKIVDWFSNFSWATLSFHNVSWIFLPASYLIISFIIWRLQEKQKLKFLKY